jgi:hypothetical protein
VASSAVAAALIAAISLVSTRIVVPRLRGLLMRVPNISGEWKSNEKADDGSDIRRIMIIRQHGVRVKAKVTREHLRKRVFYYVVNYGDTLPFT